MFKPVTFIQNQIIIHEGTIPPFACIIVSGSCALVSKKIPAQFSIKMEDPKKGEFFQAQNLGYFSKTMNSFQIGIISENQWIGDELLQLAILDRYETTAAIAIVGNQSSSDGFINPNPNPSPKPQVTLPTIDPLKPRVSKKHGFSYSVMAKTNVVAY